MNEDDTACPLQRKLDISDLRGPRPRAVGPSCVNEIESLVMRNYDAARLFVCTNDAGSEVRSFDVYAKCLPNVVRLCGKRVLVVHVDIRLILQHQGDVATCKCHFTYAEQRHLSARWQLNRGLNRGLSTASA
jgi:hypothetical protein